MRAGRLSPVFFGSALTNFGVEPFLENFLHMTMPPLPRTTADGVVDGFRRGFDAMAYSLDAALFIQGVKRDVEDIRSRLQ